MKQAASALIAVLFAAGLAVAGDKAHDKTTGDQTGHKMTEAKEVTGKVKSVSSSNFAIEDSSGKEMTFETAKGTKVTANGQTHSLGGATADSPSHVAGDGSADGTAADGAMSPRLSELLSQDQNVTVKYKEKDGKMIAKEVRVQSSQMQ